MSSLFIQFLVLALVYQIHIDAFQRFHRKSNVINILVRPSVFTQKRRNEISSRLYVIEHLVDCAANPVIAEIYGSLAKDICLKPPDGSTPSLFRGLSGLIEQAATIGFLVMSYFFFKRTANGISEWEDDDDDDDEIIRSNSNINVKRKNQGSQARDMRRCPQCNGVGKFDFDREDSSVKICDLCGGSGSIRQSIRAKPLELPSRQLWSDDFNSNDDEIGKTRN